MNPDFFEQMAMPLFDPLYNLAHWLTGDRSEAEDLVQTYTKAQLIFKHAQAPDICADLSNNAGDCARVAHWKRNRKAQLLQCRDLGCAGIAIRGHRRR